jgi:phospholipid/cholesterol/gamma-HCH transport system substrate-binding protein
MENKANTAAIGAFTLLVLALGFGFIYWMARTDIGTQAARLQIVFTGPVSGLGSGSQVLFNGIRVGDVQRLRIDASDPRRVIADLRVDPATPVKTDTSASIGFQGLTGVAYVELIGGSPETESVWADAQDGVAVIIGERSAVQDLMSGARQLMGRADDTLSAIQGLVRDNADAVNRSVGNLETFTAALSQNADQISNFVESVAAAAEDISRLSGRLEEVVARGEAVIAAVEPEAVRRTVDNVAAFSDTLAASRDDIDSMVTRFSAIAADVNAFSARLETIGERTDLLIADLGERTGALFDALEPEAIRRTVDNLDRITAAVDSDQVQRAIHNIEQVTAAVEPDAVRSAVANLSDFSETLSARRDDIDALVTRLSAISSDVSGFTADLPALRERIDAVAAAVDPERVERTIANIDRIAASVPPEAVESAVRNISEVTETLAARRQDIDDLVTRLSAISADVGNFAGGLPALRQRVDEVVAAVDTEKVARTIDNIDSVAASVPPQAVESAVTNIADLSQTLAARRGDIDELVTRLSAISADVSGFSARLPGMGERVDELIVSVDAAKVGESVDNVHRFATALGGSSEDVQAIVADVRATAERFNALSQRAESLVAGLDNLAGEAGGGLMTEVRQTLDAIRVAAENFSTQAESISGGINQFTSRGLRELQDFVGQGRRAATRLERVITNIERDPGQFLFGGEGVPEYSGGRRR